jgi:tetratricopeptide (TPR) repeat protein
MKDKPTNTPNLVLEWTISGKQNELGSQDSPFDWHSSIYIPGMAVTKPKALNLDLYSTPIDPNATYTEAVALINNPHGHSPLDRIKSYDKAIQLLQRLDLNTDTYRHNLAIAYFYKSEALKTIGTRQALTDAMTACDQVIAQLEVLDPSVPQYRKNLAAAYNHRGLILLNVKTPEALSDALKAYDQVIELLSVMKNLNTPGYWENLAAVYANKGITLCAIGTSQALTDAIAAYDKAIALLQKLNLDIPEYCDALAKIYRQKGITLQTIGTPQSLDGAVKVYDQAIELQKGLDLNVPEYCNNLAALYESKGNTLYKIKTQQALTNAIAACRQVISLRKKLDLNVPEQRNDLVRAYANKSAILCSIDTPQSLTEAIMDHDEAIKLQKGLNLDVPEYRNNLAGAHINKGNILGTIATPRTFTEAIAAYDEAIKLLKALDLSVHEYNNRLGEAYINKGITLYNINTPQALNEADALYNQVIALRKKLNFNIPEYRNKLAAAYTNKGLVLSKIHSLQALADAINAYDQAIALRKELDLGIPHYCNDLANDYNNKGTALKDVGDTQALTDAINAYDKAIALRKRLDLSVLEYCVDQAGTNVNKGIVLDRIGSPQELADAVTAYDQAIELVKNHIAQPINQRRLDIIHVAGLAYWQKGLTLLRIGNSHAACDAAAEGLTLLREQEISGIFILHDLREKLFTITLQAYTQSGQFQLLPKIVLEHLDPANAGSAPTSVKMQEAAVQYLRQVAATLYLQPQSPKALLEEIKQTLQKLAQIHVQYFGGTALSARLQAVELERMGNSDGAKKLLEGYVQLRPLDPEGYLELAAFLAKHQEIDTAINAYYNAAIRLIHRARAKGELEISIPAVTAIADKILKLKLLHQCFTEREELALTQVLKLQEWLFSDFCVRLFSAEALKNVGHQWRNELEQSLKIVGEQLELYHNRLVTQLTHRVREDAKKDAWDEFNELTRSMARTLCASIGLPWDDFQEGVTAAWLERWSYYKNEWHQASDERRVEIEDQIAQGLGYTVGEMTQQLHEKILAGSYAHLQQILGTDIWKAFQDSPEARLLACGHHWLQLPPSANSARYAGLELGMAVETCLLARLFTPLKEQLQKTGQHAAVTIDNADFSGKAGQFLKGDIGTVEFGPMAGSFGRTLKYLDAPEQVTGSSYYRDLAQYLNQLPNPAPLRDPAARKRRAAQLEAIKQRRNQCAHPHDLPTPEELQTLWAQVVGDSEHGFFRYFGTALAAPPTVADAPPASVPTAA